jgi:hypothetical protein
VGWCSPGARLDRVGGGVEWIPLCGSRWVGGFTLGGAGDTLGAPRHGLMLRVASLP